MFKWFKRAEHKDIIPGDLADNDRPEDFDPVELAKGTNVELEHTNDERIAQEIARDHLHEDRHYYYKLEKMEKGGESDWLTQQP